MNRIFKKNKSKGKGSTAAEAASVNSGDGAIQAHVPDYNVKEKELSKVHKAAWNGDVSKLRNLGGKKQDFNALDKANRTPLHLACFNGHVEIVKFLVGSKVKLNVCDSDQRSPLMRAIQGDHFDVAEFLLKRNADPTLIDINGDAALHIAVYGGFLEMVKLLLDFGAMVDATNKQGSTPLHVATIQGNSEIVEVLLHNKADVNVQDNLNRTPLMLACQADQIGIVKMLLEHKADPNIKDQKGWTANDHAIMGGFHGCSHLIEEQQTMKRTSTGSALSGTGLFGSTTNSVDALGFPLANPAATSDLSVDNEDELSIDKKSDEDSWAASNSEFDDPIPRKSVPLFGGKKTPSIKSFQSDTSMKSKEAQNTPRNNSTKGMFGTKDKKRNNVEELPGLGITPRSDVLEEEKPTPRGRTSSRGLISSGTISDWDDDSDILDDLSEKKGTALPIKIGSNLKMKKPQNDNAANIVSDQGGFNNELSDVDEDTLSEEVKEPAIAATPATPATDKLPPKNVTDAQEKADEMDENSDSDWDSEADDILPSDNSADGDGLRGYTPTGILNNSLPSGRSSALSPSEGRPSSQGAKDAGISDGSYGRGKVTPAEEERASEEEWSEEREEENEPRDDLQASSSSAKAMKKVLNTDQGHIVEKHVTQLEGSSLERDNIPTETKPISSQQSAVKDNREIENRRKMLDEERDIIEREKKKLEEEKKRQEEMIEKRLQEVQAEEDERREREMQERKKLDEERRRMEEEAREQQERLDKAKKELEEINEKKRDEMEKELEEKMRQSEKEREMELQRLEDEKQKMHEELMTERHRLAEEKKQLAEKILLQEEKEDEMKENLESRKNEEWQSVLDEKDRVTEEVKRQREALEKEKEKIDEERRKEMYQLKQDREKLEQEKEEVERVKKEAETVKQEKSRIEEEKLRLQKAEKDMEKIEMEKKRLEEEREKFEAEKKEAEKIAEEKKKLEEKKKELEKAKEEADMIEKERQTLAEERKQVEIAKKEKEKFDFERKSLEEEKKQLEAVKKGETDYVEFEKQKLERERQQLERARKDEEEYLKLEKEKMEQEKKRLEKIKMEAEEKANIEEEKLESKKQEFEARKKEEEDRMRKMQANIKQLEEKSKQLEEENKERTRAKQKMLENGKENGVVEVEPGHEEEMLDREMIESNMRKALTEVEGGEKFKKEVTVGITNDEVRQNTKPVNISRNYTRNGMVEDGESETDSEAAELVFETKPTQRGLDWHPNGLLGGAPPRNSRKTPKKATLMNGSSSGNPTVHINNWQGLLDDYDGLDYSSSSMGEDAEDDVGLGNLSPVSASTPLVPRGGTLPLSSSFHISQTGATTQLQNVLQDLRYKSAKERQSARLAQNKVRQLEAEKEDILQKLDDCINEREMLKGHNLELEKKLQIYEHEVDQEKEQRGSAELLLKKIKAQLSKKDHQLSDEQQAREQAEMALCKLQVDLRVTQNTIHQLEVERDEIQRHFTENENSLKYQQKLMETHHMKQETMYETGSVVLLEAADESRKAAWSQSEKLKEELFDMKVEMERLQFKYKGNEGALTSQIQDLESKLADLRQEQIINEDALHHASQAFHAQLTAVKIENCQLKTTVAQEQDKVAGLNTKVDTLKKENEKLLGETQSLKQIKGESERTAGNKIDKLTSLVEERKNEISHLKETVKGNEKTIESLQLKVSHLKEQLTLTNQALLERTNQLNTFQREMDKKLLTEEGHSKVIHLEREEKAKLMNKNEMLNERLDKAHEENLHLKQEMERLKTQIQQRNRDSEDARERLNSTINAVQKEKDQVKSLWEEKQVNMADNLQTLKETIGRSQSDFREKEAEVRALRQQLSDAEKKLALAEANMVVLQKTCDNKERETKDSQNELKQLQEKVMVSEMTKSRVESKLEDAQKSLQEMEHRYKESCNELTQAKKSLEQQEVDVRKLNELEREKAKLEVVVEQEKDRNQSLKKELEHAIQMKNNLEILLTELKNANLHIGEKLNIESAARNLMSQEVDDHKELWESELKSKSKLGLRLSQLQRARVDQQGQLEEEKRRNQKAFEMTKQLNEKLETERERNHQLEQTILLLRSKLKLAKKKLQDFQVPEAKIQTLQTEFERERFNLEAAIATQRKQLENANEKLEREHTARKKLEMKNNSLQLELKTAKSLEKKSSELYKSNKRLEAELADTKKSIQDSYVEKGELEKYKHTMDTKLRYDMNEKLAQVNTYLDEQCLAREKIDQVQQDTEAALRKELEKSISDLKNEVTKLRTTNSDLTAKKETLEAELQRFKTLFKQESEKCQRLTDELEQCRKKVTELKTQIRIEQQRALQLRTETPTLDLSSQNFRPPKQQQHRNADDITSSVREELNRSISRHMEGSSSDLDFQYRGHSDVNTDPASPGSSYLAVLKKNYFV